MSWMELALLWREIALSCHISTLLHFGIVVAGYSTRHRDRLIPDNTGILEGVWLEEGVRLEPAARETPLKIAQPRAQNRQAKRYRPYEFRSTRNHLGDVDLVSSIELAYS